MPIDWAATGSWMEAWAGFAGAAAVAYAAYVGRDTYKEWLRQKQMERKLHAAEQVLSAAHKFNSVFRSARSSIVSGHELAKAEEALSESVGDAFKSLDGGKRKRWLASQVVVMRLARERLLVEEFFATLPLAYAVLGEDVERMLRSLTGKLRVLRNAADIYSGLEDDEVDLIKRARRDLFGDIAMKPEDDELGTEVAKTIAELEASVRPLLKSEV